MDRTPHPRRWAGQAFHGRRPASARRVHRALSCLASLVLPASLLLAQAPSGPDCSEVPDAEGIQKLLDRKDYDSLEELAGRCRRCRSETGDGLRALEAFYDRVANLLVEDSDSQHKKLIRKLEKWKEAKPASPTPRVALSKAYEEYAWKGRGRGMGSRVTEEGRRLYRERMNLSVAELAEGVEGDPQAFVQLMKAMKSGYAPKGKEPRDVSLALFLRGIEADPDYRPLYYEMTTQLMPRWGGRTGEWSSFARDFAARRGDVEGQVLLTRMLWEKSYWYWDWDFLGKAGMEWPELKAVLDGIAAERPGSAVEKNLYAYFAILALDLETAGKLLDWIESEPAGGGEAPRKVAWVWKNRRGDDTFDHYRDVARTRRHAIFEMNMEPLVSTEGTLTFAVEVTGPDGSPLADLGYTRTSPVQDFTYMKHVPRHVRLASIPNDYPEGRYVAEMVVRNDKLATEKKWSQVIGGASPPP